MQDFEIKVVEGDKYLGMQFMTGPYALTIDKNVSLKMTKMKGAASGIRAVCNLPDIKRIGKLQAQKLLIMAQVTPICLYGMKAWLRATDEQYGKLEDGFKKAMMTILSVPSCTNYEALLRQVNNFHIRQFSDAVKLKCWNYKLHEKKRGKMVRALRFEIAHKIKDGLAGELEATCEMYRLPNICLYFLDPRTIDYYVKRHSYNLQWRKHMELRSLPIVDHPGKALNWHHLYPYAEGRAFQLYELGLLVLKDTKEWQFPERFSPCVELDELQNHIDGCEFGQKRWVETGDLTANMSWFLVALNMERVRKHGVELLWLADSESLLSDEILDYRFAQANNNSSEMEIKRLVSKQMEAEALGVLMSSSV